MSALYLWPCAKQSYLTQKNWIHYIAFNRFRFWLVRLKSRPHTFLFIHHHTIRPYIGKRRKMVSMQNKWILQFLLIPGNMFSKITERKLLKTFLTFFFDAGISKFWVEWRPNKQGPPPPQKKMNLQCGSIKAGYCHVKTWISEWGKRRLLLVKK